MRALWFLFQKLNPKYETLSFDALNSLEEECWDTFLRLFLRGDQDDPRCIEAGRTLIEIRRDQAARGRWRILSDLFGRPLPRGKAWAFTHTEANDPPEY